MQGRFKGHSDALFSIQDETIITGMTRCSGVIVGWKDIGAITKRIFVLR
jgi:hypothetical protein